MKTKNKESKKFYEEMNLEVILFEGLDIITSSNDSEDWAEEDDNF